jgi:hypothetical protein
MLTATPVVKGKYWIVEKDGQKVATIQSSPVGVTYVHNEKREQFVSIKLLKAKHNISFVKGPARKKKSDISHEVSSYPCDHTPFNALFNVSMKLPVYTKTSKSKSFFCAGYYLIKFNLEYVQSYCPKLITLNRYEFRGPYHSKTELKNAAKSLKDSG